MGDTIFAVTANRVAFSYNRSKDGAAKAVADHARERMDRLGTRKMTDEQHAVIQRAVHKHSSLDLNLHRGLAEQLSDMPIEDAHKIAIAVAHEYEIHEVPLKD